MNRLKPVDVVIVGGGWTGLLLAKEIAARTPLSVVVLERGQPRKTSDYAATMDELDYAIRLRMMQNISQETVTHRHAPGERAVPVRQYGSFLPGSGVAALASTGTASPTVFCRTSSHSPPICARSMARRGCPKI